MSYSTYLLIFPRPRTRQILALKKLIVASRMVNLVMAMIVVETSLTRMVMRCIRLIFSFVNCGSIS